MQNLSVKEYLQRLFADSLFYLDPPYVGSENYYKMRHGFGIKEHKELCTILKSLQGKFILSYNDCALVRELYKDFRILESKEVRYSLNIKVSRKTREVIVVNY